MTSKPSDLLDHGNVVGASLEATIELDRVWGNARLGLIMVSAFFSATSYSTDQLSHLSGMSPETVRRYLKPLINVGRVRVFKDGRRVTYKAKQEWAIKTRDMLNGLVKRIEDSRNGSNDNNLATLVTVNRMFTRVDRASDLSG